MLNVLLVTFPFFALVLCGFVATRRRWLALEAIGGLNAFVLYLALPALLFRFGSTTPIGQLLDAAVFAVYLLAALLMVALAVLLARRARRGWNDAAMGALVAAFPNTGFMGVPLLAALLGPQSVGTVIVLIVVDMVVTSSICIALARLGTPGGVGAALRAALRSVLGNPMPWAIVLGALASATGWRLPLPLEQTVWLLADAAAPVALFAIGAVLARSQMQASAAAPLWHGDVWLLALMKLLLHPLLVWGLGTAAMALGAPLAPATLTVMVLVAALPGASNVALLAERLGADTGRIARVILVTTALAFLSFAAAVAWLQPSA